MTDIYLFRYYCTNTGTYQSQWLAAAPTECIHDAAHTIENTAIIDKKSDTEMVVRDDDNTSIFRLKGYKVTITTGVDAVTTTTISYPYDVKIYGIRCMPVTANIGDMCCFSIAPRTMIGQITSDVTASDTVINVSSSVLSNIYIGTEVYLKEGATEESLGECIEKNVTNGTITVENGAVNAYTAAGPTLVEITNHKGQDIYLNNTKFFDLGSMKMGGSLLPKNTDVEFKYTNKDGAAKDFVYQLEMGIIDKSV